MVPNSIIHIRVDVTYRKPRALGFYCGHTLKYKSAFVSGRKIEPNMDDTVWYHSVRSRHWWSEPGTARGCGWVRLYLIRCNSWPPGQAARGATASPHPRP